jgi:hypothetical protein
MCPQLRIHHIALQICEHSTPNKSPSLSVPVSSIKVLWEEGSIPMTVIREERKQESGPIYCTGKRFIKLNGNKNMNKQ